MRGQRLFKPPIGATFSIRYQTMRSVVQVGGALGPSKRRQQGVFVPSAAREYRKPKRRAACACAPKPCGSFAGERRGVQIGTNGDQEIGILVLVPAAAGAKQARWPIPALGVRRSSSAETRESGTPVPYRRATPSEVLMEEPYPCEASDGRGHDQIRRMERRSTNRSVSH